MINLDNFTWANLSNSMAQTKAWAKLPTLPKGEHHAVLYPGLATPAASLALLHMALQSKGIVCHEWEQGFNTGITPEVERKAMEHLVRLMRTYPQAKWHLVGWSLGGLLARELAKTLNEPGLRIESTTTMGTPINNMPNNERVLAIYRMFNKELPEDDVFFEKSLYMSPPCRSLSIYSRQDAVVPWKACIQSPLHTTHDVAKNHEVRPGHLAMTNHPSTWTALVQWMGNAYTGEASPVQEDAEMQASTYWEERTAA